MSSWIDTQTEAILQPPPPEKLAPADTGPFALVLVEKGKDAIRMAESLANVPGLSQQRVAAILAIPCPVPLLCGLSITDAVLGQFELVCSDSISIFLRNEVAVSDHEYLKQLCSQCRSSAEFEWINFKIASIPRTDHGRRFVRQFLGAFAELEYNANANFQFNGQLMRKKARIMAHWAQKIGVQVDTPLDDLIV